MVLGTSGLLLGGHNETEAYYMLVHRY